MILHYTPCTHPVVSFFTVPKCEHKIPNFGLGENFQKKKRWPKPKPKVEKL